MKQMMVMAAVMQAVLGTAALACDGQTGAMVFEDKFPDDSGGWDETAANMKIVPPAMEMSVDHTYQSIATQNLTFNAGNAEYCMQVTFPPAVASNVLTAGIEFWASDYNNTFAFMIGDDQYAALYKKVGGNWNTIFTGIKVDGFKATAGAVHTILVQAKAGTLSFSVDGTKVKTTRAQMPAGDLRFGAYVQSGNDVAETDPAMVFKVSEFSVTAGE